MLRIRATAAGTLTAVRPDNARPSVDVVVPFAGTDAALRSLLERLRRLTLRDGDTLTVVDNRPPGAPSTDGVLRAPDRQSSYFARNRGVAARSNPWLLFIDADVIAPADLVERYFEREPGDSAGVLAGGIVDEPVEPGGAGGPTARYSMLRGLMGQPNTLVAGRWAYAQTANCAVRREAFEQVGGFRDDLRSGGDADLCFRLTAAGWEIEPREDAAVVHQSRTTLRKLLRQQARHGSGAAWLAREYPGAFPRAKWPGLAKWTLQSLGTAAAAGARRRRDDALVATYDPLVKWAFELGRLFPNEVRER